MGAPALPALTAAWPTALSFGPGGAQDARWMRVAMALGRRHQGQVWPNPAVGCVLVRGGRVVGRGWTQPGGRPHAETEALARAGADARGATCYVTLEPCANWGHTPPCAAALIEAGVQRVVIACLDPDPRVDGRGIAWLRQAGLDVEVGLLEGPALETHAGLYRRIRAGRPMVTLKLAQSLDGRIAGAGGQSRWISGEAARAATHALRAEHDAILVGSGTALADDPLLTCRLPGLAAASPVRVVLDRRLRLRPTSALARSAGQVPLWVLTRSDAPAAAARDLEALGALVLRLAPEDDARAALAVLAARGITRLLVEGGAEIAAALLGQELVDRLCLVTAPIILGNEGIAWAELGRPTDPSQAARWQPIAERRVGPDHIVLLTRPQS